MFKKEGQFIATHQGLKGLLQHYGVGDFKYEFINTGIENSTYIIEADSKFVIRVYRKGAKTADKIRREIDFMQELYRRRLPVPKVILNKAKNPLTIFNEAGHNWQAIAMEFIEGHHHANYNTHVIDQLAHYQAKMHQIGVSYGHQHKEKPELQLVPGEFTNLINKKLCTPANRELLGRIESYKVYLDPKLECGYVHNDYDIENVLFDDRNDIQAILDFDDLTFMPVVVCLAFSLWSVLFESKKIDYVDRYIKVYCQTRPLSTMELDYILKIILFRHYAIASLTILRNQMGEEELKQYENIEKQLRTLTKPNHKPIHILHNRIAMK